MCVLTLPTSANSLLVRTNFDDENAWGALSAEVANETDDGFRAYVEVVSDSAWSGATPEAVLEAARRAGGDAALLFIADQRAHSDGFPILVVDLVDDDLEPFRCVASELWSVDNNLNLGNMDWEEFSEATDSAGVFRGFE